MAQNDVYDVGDRPRAAMAFTTPAGAPADPTIILCKIKDPAGTVTTLTYLADAGLVRDSIGNYHIDQTLDKKGIWSFRFEGTGAVTAASEDFLIVRDSVFY